jgi:hypothetical protein
MHLCVGRIAALFQAFGLGVGLWGLGNVLQGGWGFFFAEEEKKQNKFPSNLHCLIIKLNPLIYHFL